MFGLWIQRLQRRLLCVDDPMKSFPNAPYVVGRSIWLVMSIGWLLWQPGLTITQEGKSSLFKYKENIRPIYIVRGKLQQKQWILFSLPQRCIMNSQRSRPEERRPGETLSALMDDSALLPIPKGQYGGASKNLDSIQLFSKFVGHVTVNSLLCNCFSTIPNVSKHSLYTTIKTIWDVCWGEVGIWDGEE